MAAGAWRAGIRDFIVSVLRFVLSPLIFVFQQRRPLGRYLLFALRVVIFPLGFYWAFQVARRHREVDPRGPSKVAAAAVIGILLAAGVVVFWYGFQEDARDGMYDQADNRLAVAVGENAYQSQVTAATAAEDQLVTLNEQLDTNRAMVDNSNAKQEQRDSAAANVTAFEASIVEVEAALAEARTNAAELEDNHAFYQDLRPVVQAQDDERAKAMIAAADLETSGDFPVTIWDDDRMDRRAARAFEIKDDAEDDMQAVMVWLVFPSAIGALFGPLFIALGSVLANDFEGSESVGYKKYPGASLGLFLLLGGLGWPSIIFSAWGMWDIDVREATGQIAL